jgi:hypothetical protein
MKCFAIPVITGATGLVSISLNKSGNDTRTAFNKLSEKTVILGTSYIIRKVLQSET